jgi:transcriptional regulator with XRE-family HTH domain
MTKGQRIKSQRESLGISQTDLAKSIGVSKQTLYKYEHDIVTNIPSDVVERLSRALQCSPAFIMGWSDALRFEAYNEKFMQLSEKHKESVMQYIDFISRETDS